MINASVDTARQIFVFATFSHTQKNRLMRKCGLINDGAGAYGQCMDGTGIPAIRAIRRSRSWPANISSGSTRCRTGRAAPPNHWASGAIFCSMAPNMLCPSWPFISIRMVSPYFMKPVEGLPSWMDSIARFSAMQL